MCIRLIESRIKFCKICQFREVEGNTICFDLPKNAYIHYMYFYGIVNLRAIAALKFTIFSTLCLYLYTCLSIYTYMNIIFVNIYLQIYTQICMSVCVCFLLCGGECVGVQVCVCLSV